PEEHYAIPLGKADVKRTGTDVTILATGVMVTRSLEAAEDLMETGISAEVVDPRTLVPLDEVMILQSVRKTGRVIVVHEAVKECGDWAVIASIIVENAFYHLEAPIKRLCGEVVHMPSSPKLEASAVAQVTDILRAVEALMEESKNSSLQ